MENKKPITYSTFGSCVTRDIFSFCDNNKRFQKVRHMGFFSPAAIFMNKPDNIRELEIATEQIENGFNKRNTLLELHQGFFDYLLEENSDYLIVDLYDIRLPILMDGNKGLTYYTYKQLKWVQTLRDILGENYKITNASELELDFISEQIEKIAKKLLSIYPSTHIILVETDNAVVYRSEEKTLAPFPRSFIEDSCLYVEFLIKFSNDIFKKQTNCLSIRLPQTYRKYLLSCKEHRWGRSPVHYTLPVYEYFYDAICKISVPEYNSCEEKILNKIKYEYFKALKNTVIKPHSSITTEVFRLCTIDNIYEYLDCLYSLSNCIVLIAVKDNTGQFITGALERSLRNLGLLYALNLKWLGYIAIIKNGSVVYEKLGNNDNGTDCSEYYCDMIDRYNIDVMSSPLKIKNTASICIDNFDYCVNKRGLNIVTLDLNSGKVVDSIAVDTFEKNLLVTHRTDFHSEAEMFRLELQNFQKKEN